MQPETFPLWPRDEAAQGLVDGWLGAVLRSGFAPEGAEDVAAALDLPPTAPTDLADFRASLCQSGDSVGAEASALLASAPLLTADGTSAKGVAVALEAGAHEVCRCGPVTVWVDSGEQVWGVGCGREGEVPSMQWGNAPSTSAVRVQVSLREGAVQAQLFACGGDVHASARAQCGVPPASRLVTDADCMRSNVGWLPFDTIPTAATPLAGATHASAEVCAKVDAVIAHMGLFPNPRTTSVPAQRLHQLLASLH